MKTPITNPLHYSRVRKMVGQLKLQLAQMTRSMELHHEARLQNRGTIMEQAEQLRLKDLVIAERVEEIRLLQMKLDAKTVDANGHSPLVKQLIDKIIQQGDSEFEYDSNGPDRMVCQHCHAYSNISYDRSPSAQRRTQYDPIDHSKDCPFILATAIKEATQ
jgi:hypothetical protein